MAAKAVALVAIISGVLMVSYFSPESKGMAADRVVLEIAAEQGKGLK